MSKVSTREVLARARERITSPLSWIKGYAAVNENGAPVTPEDGCKWCLTGSVDAVAAELGIIDGNGGVYNNVQTLLSNAANQLYGTTPVDVNDRIGHLAALEVCDYAIRLADEDTSNNDALLRAREALLQASRAVEEQLV